MQVSYIGLCLNADKRADSHPRAPSSAQQQPGSLNSPHGSTTPEVKIKSVKLRTPKQRGLLAQTNHLFLPTNHYGPQWLPRQSCGCAQEEEAAPPQHAVPKQPATVQVHKRPRLWWISKPCVANLGRISAPPPTAHYTCNRVCTNDRSQTHRQIAHAHQSKSTLGGRASHRRQQQLRATDKR